MEATNEEMEEAEVWEEGAVSDEEKEASEQAKFGIGDALAEFNLA